MDRCAVELNVEETFSGAELILESNGLAQKFLVGFDTRTEPLSPGRTEWIKKALGMMLLNKKENEIHGKDLSNSLRKKSHLRSR